MLVVFHGLVPADPILLAISVGLFATSGLLATAFARQDAADSHKGRLLGGATALLPALVSLSLMSAVRPGALNSFWSSIARLLELLLLPLSLLMAWLASLLPAPAFAGLPPMPQQPAVDPRNLDSKLNGHEMPDWIAWTALLLVVGLVLFLVMGVVRMLLEGGMAARTRYEASESADGVVIESTGDPRSDMGKALGWLLRFLRRRGPAKAQVRGEAQLTARVAYRRLLQWAAQHGLARRTSETTHQLQARIVGERPEIDPLIAVVTTGYERERYGDVHSNDEELREMERALQQLATTEPR
jgi:hypothetical protein